MALSPLQWMIARAGAVALAVVFATLVTTNYSTVALHSQHLASAAESDLAACSLMGSEKSDAMRELCHNAEHVAGISTVANVLLEALKLSLFPRFLIDRASGASWAFALLLVFLVVVGVMTARCLRGRA